MGLKLLSSGTRGLCPVDIPLLFKVWKDIVQKTGTSWGCPVHIPTLTIVGDDTEDGLDVWTVVPK